VLPTGRVCPVHDWPVFRCPPRRIRLTVLGSFGKWAAKHSRLEKNPMEVITLPAKRSRIPGVPKMGAPRDLQKVVNLFDEKNGGGGR
jgi:hypothetical protein